MSTLRNFLNRQNIGFLKIMAFYWRLDIHSQNSEDCVDALQRCMLDAGQMEGCLSSCSDQACEALASLSQKKGSMELNEFSALYGEIRVMGLNRIEREEPWKVPVSAAEELWYRGLIYQAMMEVQGELRECVCIPDDLLAVIGRSGVLRRGNEKSLSKADDLFLVRPASPQETCVSEAADDAILDLCCLLLAAKRSEKAIDALNESYGNAFVHFAEIILNECGMLPASTAFSAEELRRFLVENRHAALLSLAIHWRESQSCDEIAQSPGLCLQEPLDYAPAAVRETILKKICRMQTDGWWSISGLCASVEQEDEQFLRRNIHAMVWQVSDSNGHSLAGSGSWEQLEGTYLRFLLSGPLHWLGILDIAWMDTEREKPGGFRISPIGKTVLKEIFLNQVPETLEKAPNREKGAPAFSMDGRIICGKTVPRMFRYQAARYCVIEKVRRDECVLRITPDSLAEAAQNGLTVSALITLSKRFGGSAFPASLECAILNWEKENVQALIYPALILSVSNGQIIDRLMQNRDAQKSIVQRLNPTNVMIKAGGVEAIRRALMELKIIPAIKEKE